MGQRERLRAFQQAASIRAGDGLGDRAKDSGESSACARVDAVSTNALGLEQKEHLKEEGNSSFGFRNIWLIMVEMCWAVGNMGGTVAREKRDLGRGIQRRGVWMRDEATGHYEILPREEVWGQRGGRGRKGQERPARSWEKTQHGSGDPEAETGKNRKKKNQDGKLARRHTCTILVRHTKALLYFSPCATSHDLMVILQLFTRVLLSVLLVSGTWEVCTRRCSQRLNSAYFTDGAR